MLISAPTTWRELSRPRRAIIAEHRHQGRAQHAADQEIIDQGRHLCRNAKALTWPEAPK